MREDGAPGFERFSVRVGGLFMNYGVVPGVNGKGIQAVVTRNETLLA